MDIEGKEMEQLNEVEPEVKVAVKQIEGGKTFEDPLSGIGKTNPINYLVEGEQAKISKIIGGTTLKENFEQLDEKEVYKW
jgi:hypothetical protein